MTLFLDYRSQPDEDLSDRRPEVAAGELWTDRDFTLHQAIQDGSVTSNLTWKRATVSEYSVAGWPAQPQVF